MKEIAESIRDDRAAAAPSRTDRAVPVAPATSLAYRAREYLLRQEGKGALVRALGAGAACLFAARIVIGSGMLGVIAWFVLIAATLCLAWRADLTRPPRRFRWFSGRGEAAALVLALVGCGALRCLHLGTIPPTVHPDSAECGNVGRALLAGVDGDVFDFSTWYNTPYLSYLPYAASFSAGGISVATLRLPSAITGTLALLPLYFLARTWLGMPYAFLCVTLFATSHAAVHFSRIGLWNIQVLFYAAATFALVSIGFRRRSMTWLTLAGVVSGLSVYSYTAGRLIPIVAAVYLLKHLTGPRRHRSLNGIRYFIAGLSVTIAPLVLSYAKRPEILATDRTSSVWVLSDANAAHVRTSLGVDSSGAILWEQIKRTAQGFYALGDMSGQFGTPYPILSAWSAMLACAGLLWVAQTWRHDRSLFLLVWTGSGLLLGSVLVVDPPSLTRLVPVLPAAFILVAAGMKGVLDRLGPTLTPQPTYRAIVAVCCAVVAGQAAAFDRHAYAEYVHQLTLQPTEWDVLKVMEQVAGRYDYYLFTGPYLFADSPVLRLFADGTRAVSSFSAADLPDELGRDSVFLVTPEFRPVGLKLSEKFPGIEREVVEQDGVRQMVVYRCTQDNGCLEN